MPTTNPAIEYDPAANPAPDADKTYAKVSWRIVPFIMLCYVVAYLDRINVGFAQLQMKPELGFSDAVFGLGAGVFFLGYFLFELPSNLILNRVGAKRWIARIMISWGVVSGSFIWVRTPHMFYFLRFLLGVAEAGFYPGIILYLTRWYPSHRRAAVIAVFMSAIPISGIFGNPLSGWIMQFLHGKAGLHGWQWMFLIEGMPAILVGIAVLFVLDNNIASAKWLSGREKEFLESEVSADHQHKDNPLSILEVFKDIRIWHMAFIDFCFVMGQYGLTFWLPTLVQATNIKGDFKIGLVSAIPFLVAVVAMNLFARSADARRERRWHLIIPQLMGAVGIMAAGLLPHAPVLTVVFLSIAMSGVLTCPPLFWSLPTAFLSSKDAPAGIGVINSFANLAGFLSPYLMGYLKVKTKSNLSGMLVVAGFLVVGALATWIISPEKVNR
jgi:D-galactonate transporter